MDRPTVAEQFVEFTDGKGTPIRVHAAYIGVIQAGEEGAGGSVLHMVADGTRVYVQETPAKVLEKLEAVQW